MVLVSLFLCSIALQKLYRYICLIAVVYSRDSFQVSVDDDLFKAGPRRMVEVGEGLSAHFARWGVTHESFD